MSLTNIRNIIVIRPQEHAVRRMRGVYVEATGHIIVDTINADGNSEIAEFDFTTLSFGPNQRRNSATLTEPDFFRGVSVAGFPAIDDTDRVRFDLDWYHAAGSAPSQTTHTVKPEFGDTYPQYAFWGTQPQVRPTPTATYIEEIPYPQKQERAIAALETWRAQKRAWLLELEQRSDLHPQLVEHGGYWLRAADAALQIEFQDPDTDPLVVAKMAQQAALGAADIDSVDKFAMYLNGFITQFPNGPDRPTLWVTKGEGAGSVADVQRVNLVDSHQYPVGTLADDYNPIDSEWQVPNQPGVVSVNTVTPDANSTVTAEVLDPDDVVGTPTYQWQKLISGVWTDETGETGSSYLIVDGTAAGTQFRCLAAYTDNYGPNQSAISQVITVQ